MDEEMLLVEMVKKKKQMHYLIASHVGRVRIGRAQDNEIKVLEQSVSKYWEVLLRLVGSSARSSSGRGSGTCSTVGSGGLL